MELLKFLESIRTPFFDAFFSVLTRLGETAITLVVILPIFWCVNKRLGYKMIYSAVYSLGLNQFIKVIVRRPRPWVQDPTFTTVHGAQEAATGYSFPSGHTANATVLFGTLSTVFKKKWVKILLWALIAAIAFSRLYLGVHFLSDVLVSLLITALLVAVVIRVVDLAENSTGADTALNLGLILLSAALLVYCIITSNADEASQHALKNAYTMAGVSCGLVFARFLDRRYINFSVKAPLPVQIFKLAAGTALTLLIRVALKSAFSMIGLEGFAFSAVRYFILVVFMAAVWPATFKFWVTTYNKICGK